MPPWVDAVRGDRGNAERRGALAEVLQDAFDGAGLGLRTDDAHAAVSARALKHVDSEDPAQKLGPGRRYGGHSGALGAFAWAGRGGTGTTLDL